MTLRAAVVRQFALPSGWPGQLAGWIMARRPSNRARNMWTVNLLKIDPGDRVLEIGCGPGVGLAAASARLTSGRVVGLDHSAVMIDQAASRNRHAVADGTVALVHGGIEAIPTLPGPFDKVFSVNAVQFLPEPAEAFRRLRAVMAPDGVIATTHQPRHRRPTRADALAAADRIADALRDAGLEIIGREELPLRPAPAFCVLARRPKET